MPRPSIAPGLRREVAPTVVTGADRPSQSPNQLPSERARLVTFDRGVTEEVECQRPDHYRLVEADQGLRPRVARGGGYSYAAASFGAESLVLDMTRFNRALRFEPEARLIEVEAGITVGELLKLTAPAGLWLPVQPGYPAITVGGCIAANVHGKNPYVSGTFRHSVLDITLVHPRHGTVRLDASRDRELFDLTIGGYGLTGLITAATLRLAPLPGTRLSMRRIPLEDLASGLAHVLASSPQCAFSYTWQDAAPSARPFGRGIAYEGTFVVGPPRLEDCGCAYWRIGPGSSRLPVSAWNRRTAGVVNWAYRAVELLKPAVKEISLFDSLFPFARRPEIFLMFGRRGFIEYQVIVPRDRAEVYVRGLQSLLARGGLPSVLVSMKLFKGTQRLLRFEGDGACVTLYLARTNSAADVLPVLDELAVKTGSIPNIIKDSRLPLSAVRSLYPEYDLFRTALRSYDPERLLRSELSERLGL